MAIEELLNPSQCIDEVLRKVGERDFADYHEQRYAVLNDRGQLVGRVANALVVGNRDATVASAVFQPLLVRAVGRGKVVVPLDGQAGGGEDFGEAFA